MKHKDSPKERVQLLIVACMIGLAVAAVSAQIINPDVPPGGSFTASAVVGLQFPNRGVGFLLCGVAGIVGWVIFRLIAG